MSNPLRNPNIDYERGWFSVTVQAACNKSVFGAIVGESCELNELGRAVHDAWLSHPAHTPGLYIDEFVVMPNHFHAIVKLTPAPARSGAGPRNRGLPWVVGKFKSYTTHLYLEMKGAGRCGDIGPRLWQSSFFDNLISSHDELESVRRYFRDNPKNWNHDRFGPVTTYCVGNAELLSCRLVAFVASETPPGRSVADVPDRSGSATREWKGMHSRGPAPLRAGDAGNCPVISTFTSPEEREIREKCLRGKRAFVWVCPGGIWEPLPPAVEKACEEGWAFVCSPVPTGTRVNKQRAIWCNQYVIRQAESVWVGTIRPGGSLETLLNAIRGKETQ